MKVTPNQKDAFLTFHLRNEGNSVQDFDLSALSDNGNPYGLTDDSNMTLVGVFVEEGSTAGYQSGTDVATFVDDLTVDTNATVYLVYDIPGARVDGNVSEYTLQAKALIGGAAGKGAVETNDDGIADVASTVQTVFADAAGTTGDIAEDGNHSDFSAFEVQAAVLSFRKWSIVTEDPINAGTNPKRIPGATIYYCFEIKNTGTKDASGIYWIDKWDVGNKSMFKDFDNNTTADSEISDPEVDLTDCAEDCTGITAGALSGAYYDTNNTVRMPAEGDTLSLPVNNRICANIKAVIK